MRRALLAYAFALAGGLLWALAFRQHALLLAPWVALAPLVLLLGHPRAGLLAWVYGFAFWAASIYWIAPTLHTFGGLPWAVAVPLLGLLAAYLALFHAAFGLLGKRFWRRPGAGWALVGLPALWVALEQLRGWLFSGFPWNLTGYAWVGVPGALPLASWMGVFGVSFVVMLANTGVALALVRRRFEAAAVAFLVPLLLLALAGRRATAEAPLELPSLPVRVVQPNIPNQVEPRAEVVLANYRDLLELSREACQPGSLVVWPESAAWPFVYVQDRRLERGVEELAERGCALLFNSVQPAAGGYYNSVYLVDAGGVRGRYDKRHLVPFGEYVPLRGVFSFLDKLARNAGEYLTGRQVELLPWRGQRIGVAICFEITFPGEVSELVRDGASLLVTVTNDAWYGDTSAPWQHLTAARFRAAENRRFLLRAAITGVSAIIAPDGSVVGELGVFERGLLRARVAGEGGLTPYSRWPWAVPAACWLLAAMAFVIIRKPRS